MRLSFRGKTISCQVKGDYVCDILDVNVMASEDEEGGNTTPGNLLSRELFILS